MSFRYGSVRPVWWVWGVCLSALLAWATAAAAQLPTWVGQLGMWVEDDPQGARMVWTLYGADGEERRLALDDAVLAAAGGIDAVLGRWVEVAADPLPTRDGRARVQSIRLAPAPRAMANFGVDPAPTEHWLNLPCKFSDTVGEPATPTQIESFYGQVAAALNGVSRGVHTFTSETRPWAALPNPLSYYQANNDLVQLYRQCRTAHAVPIGRKNVNIILAEEPFPFAIGGQLYENNQLVRVTWLPPFGWRNLGVAVHEIGHGYGMPHSSNSDGDSFAYDNPWDVMSTTRYAVDLGPGLGGDPAPTNSYHAYKLGWLDGAGQAVIVPPGQSISLTVNHWGAADDSAPYVLLLPLDSPDPRYAAQLYAIEARRGSGDAGNQQRNLPDADGVLIYSVDTTRSEPAWLVNHTDQPGDDTAVVYTVGESFQDPVWQVEVTVTAATADGYTVSITRGTPVIEPTATPTPQAGQADLSISVQGSTPNLVYPDGAVELMFQMWNVGTTTAPNPRLEVELSDVMREQPNDNTFQWGGLLTNVRYGRTARGLYISADALPPGYYLSVIIRQYPDASGAGVWTMRATASHQRREATPADNTAVRSLLVLPAVGATPAGLQVLTNPSFDAAQPRDLSGWTLRRAPGTRPNDNVRCDDAGSGVFVSYSAPCAFRFVGDASSNTRLIQTAALSNPPLSGDSAMVIGARVKAANVPAGGATLKAVIRFGSTTATQTATINVPANTQNQYRPMWSRPVVLRYPDPIQVTFTAQFRGQNNRVKLWLDDLAVILTP